jgi:hypothetical protein
MLPTKAEVLGARVGDALPFPPSPQPTRVVAMAPVRPAARDRPSASAAHARMPIHDLAAQLRLELGPAVGTEDRAGAQPLPRQPAAAMTREHRPIVGNAADRARKGAKLKRIGGKSR